MRPWILLLLTAGASLGAFWNRDTPRELGEVRWERNLDAAFARSASEAGGFIDPHNRLRSR